MQRDLARIEAIQDAMHEENLDGLVCSLPANVLLLTGYWPVIASALAIVIRNSGILLIVPEDEIHFAGRGWADYVKSFRPGGLESLQTTEEAVRQPLGDVLQSFGTGSARIGYENGGLVEPSSYAAMHLYGPDILSLISDRLPHAQLIPAAGALSRLRSVKTAAEIDRIKHACRLAADAFERGAAHLRAGINEYQAAGQFLFAPAADEASTDAGRLGGFTWCMSGPNAAKACAAFAHSESRRLQPSDLALVHCNSYAGGFWTDITRTYCLSPRDNRSSRMYEAVFAARAAALDAAHVGTKAAAVDEAARRVFRDRGFGDAFKHATGHGVGFGAISGDAIPRLHPKSPDVLREGMVFNVEPALYFDGYGGLRHCDMFAMTASGAELLTSFHASIAEWTIL